MKKILTILIALLLLTCVALAENHSPEDQAALDAFRADLDRLTKDAPENITPRLLWDWAKDVTAFTIDSNGETCDLNCGIYADIDPYKLEIGFGYGLSSLASCLYYNQDIFNETATGLKPVSFQHRFGLAGELLDFLADNREALMQEIDNVMSSDDRYKVVIAVSNSDDADRVYVITYRLDSGESSLIIA